MIWYFLIARGKKLCNHGVPFTQILRKRCKNLCRQSQTFNDETQIFLKKLLLTHKDEHDVFIFCIFLHEYKPVKSPSTLGITTQPWRSATLPSTMASHPKSVAIGRFGPLPQYKVFNDASGPNQKFICNIWVINALDVFSLPGFDLWVTKALLYSIHIVEECFTCL